MITIKARYRIEAEILQIWHEIIGQNDFNYDDNFLDAGGSSLLILQLVNELKVRLGYHLSIRDIVKQPTVRGIAVLIRGGVIANDSFLIPLQSQGTKIPLYCVHGLGGSAINYFPLARALGPEQPTFSLQAPALSGRTEPIDNVISMATVYAAEIAQRQVSGPYFVAGYSFGGIVALEVASELSRLTGAASAVILLDSGFSYEEIDCERYPYRALVQYVLRINLNLSDLHDKSQVDALCLIRAAAISQGIFSEAVTIDQLSTIYDVVAANCRAAASYRPRFYPHPCLLLRSTDQPEMGRDLGWSPYIKNLATVTFAVSHYGIIDPEGASVISESIAGYLATALTSAG